MSRRDVVWTALVCLLWGVGCGPDQEQEDEGPPEDTETVETTLSLEEYASTRAGLVAREQCEVVYVCEHARDFALARGWGGYGDQDACEASRGARIASNLEASLVAGVDSGALEYDPVSAQACLDALEALDDPCTFEDAFQTLDVACAEVFTGVRAQGEACAFDVECGEGLRCASGEDLACGRTCEPEESCGGQTCGEGTQCVVFFGRREQCEPVVELGEECNGDWECAGDAQCLRVAPDPVGLCTARGVQGQDEPCDGDDFFCAQGLVCDGRKNTCFAPRAALMGDEGDACSVPDGEFCALGLTCLFDDVDPFSRAGECGAPRAQGEACAFESECEDELSCLGVDYATRTRGECGRLLADGEVCVSGFDCISNVCTDGACGLGACGE